MDTKAPQQLGKYDLLWRIGYGGMAEVYLARQRGFAGFEKLVAIKRILPHLKNERTLVRMFLDEARIAARINHPNVVQIFDLGQVDDVFFIAMEYLEGETLVRVMGQGIKREKPLPISLGAATISRVARGLHHAHELTSSDGKLLNIVHRDVSPHNVILLDNGGIKLLDFGIAKARERLSETTCDTLKGKFSYMSPEQCESGTLDRRSDVFSAGVVLWEILTRRRLFWHRNKLKVLQKIAQGNIVPPSSINPEVPRNLDEISLKALAHSPNDRFQTAEELADVLDDFLSSSSLETGPGAFAAYMRSTFNKEQTERKTAIAEALNAASLPVKAQESAEYWLSLIPTGEEVSTPQRIDTPTNIKLPQSTPSSDVRTDKPQTEHTISSIPKRTRLWIWRLSTIVATVTAASTIVILLLSRDSGIKSHLRVESQPPNAEIFVDNRSTGKTTPSVVGPFDPGSHTVAILLNGHSLWQRKVTLEQNETLRIEAALQPKNPTTPLETKDTSPLSSKEPDAGQKQLHDVKMQHKISSIKSKDSNVSTSVANEPDAQIPDQTYSQDTSSLIAPETKAYGFLNLATDPWATIYYKNKQLGDTPLVKVRLPVGKIRLTAINPEEKIHHSFTVTIKKDEILRKTLNLLPGNSLEK